MLVQAEEVLYALQEIEIPPDTEAAWREGYTAALDAVWNIVNEINVRSALKNSVLTYQRRESRTVTPIEREPEKADENNAQRKNRTMSDYAHVQEGRN